MPPSAHAALVISIIASAIGALVMCLLVARYGLTPAAEEADSGTQRLFTRFGHALGGVCFAATAIMAIVALGVPRQVPPSPAVAVQPDPAAEARLRALTAEVKSVSTRLDQLEGRVSTVDGAARTLGDELASVSLRTRQMERALVPPPRRVGADAPAKPAAREAVKDSGAARDAEREQRVSERFTPIPTPVVPDVPAPAPPPLVLSSPTPEPAAAARPTPASRTPDPVVRTPSRTPDSTPRAPEATPASRPLPTASRAPDARVSSGQPAGGGQGAAAATGGDPDLGDKLRDDWKTIRGGFSTAGDEFKAAVRDLGRKLWR